ncbi:MAG: hypothetical protein COB76_01600 [Alphaproteobacteria bacterium]|nr:MAG: hypothetical protein COB76_01600 [Alphaproteobacteria bacterium]
MELKILALKGLIDVNNFSSVVKYVFGVHFERLKSIASPFINGRATVNKGVRLRDEDGTFLVTYKELVDGDLVEIESTIEKHDFDALYPSCKDHVKKWRWTKDIDADKWFVDYLIERERPGGQVYFIQAEVEMPEGLEKPSFIPPEIEKNILHHVARNDVRFNNRNLSNVNATKALYASLSPQ